MEKTLSIPAMKTRFAQSGKVEWIGLRPARRAPLEEVTEASVTKEAGLINDHYSGKSGNRQLTLIQSEHLNAVAAMLGLERVPPEWVRRNIVVSGINLLALKDSKFKIGDCELEFTGLCHPCSRMEENLGEGGYNAMRGHGGITTRVLKGGTIKLGDTITFLETVEKEA